MAERIPPVSLYIRIFIALIVLLIITVGVSFIDIKGANTPIAIGIACIKAVLIILFFMHIRFQPWIMWSAATAGFLWLGIMFTLTSSDYLTRNHPPDTSPKGEPTFIQNADESPTAR